MHSITINDYSVQVPGKWDELTADNLRLLSRSFGAGTTEIDLKTHIALQMLGLKLKKKEPVIFEGKNYFIAKAKKHKPLFISAYQLAFILKTLKFLTKKVETEGEETSQIIESQLTRQLLPFFRFRMKKYYGPDDRLFNITLDEYLEADIHYLAFMKSQDEKELNKLIATLYRKKNNQADTKSPDYSGDIRQPFNEHLIDVRARKIARMPHETKLMVFFFFQGCRNFLSANFPDVFTHTSGATGRDYGPMSLVDALSGEDVTKNETIRKTLLYDVMVRLQRAAEAAEELRKNTKT